MEVPLYYVLSSTEFFNQQMGITITQLNTGKTVVVTI